MVHRLLNLSDPTKAVESEMHPILHHEKDFFELQKLLLLSRDQWIRFEERNDLASEISLVPNVENQQVFAMVVMSAVTVDLSALEEAKKYLECTDASFALNYREPGLTLPTQSHNCIPLDRAAKAALSIYEADDPLLDSWPFLLIVRTGRIVTAHVITIERGCDTNEYRRMLGVPSI
jgi:hypothetical protein